MTEKLQMYKCEACGNIIQVLIPGEGKLVCCDKEMELLVPHTDEMLGEKHVPVFKKTDDGGAEIIVGSIPHPMTEEHYIMFIEKISEDKNFMKLKYLHPGDEPKMKLLKAHKNACANAYCNLHGFWEGKSD
jgi:superoxide reductase